MALHGRGIHRPSAAAVAGERESDRGEGTLKPHPQGRGCYVGAGRSSLLLHLQKRAIKGAQCIRGELTVILLCF